jgi:hypothetical protein
MKRNREIGLERRDGFDVGRDPRAMSADELGQLGHARVSPLRALRLKCLDCCNDSAQEVRLCTAVDCPNWPFRMGKNPWASEARREIGRSAARRLNADRTAPQPDRPQTRNSLSDGAKVPPEQGVDFSLNLTDEKEENQK